MSVIITTSLGDITIDLHTDKCPLTTKSFLKLCKIKYFNGCLFHTVQKDFTAQTGDPSGKGTGGDSIYKFLYGEQARFFGDETHPDLKHSKLGTVAMASAGENLNASQFYITLRDDLDYLDGKHTVFGQVEEGLEVLARINEAYVDDKGRPYKNIRIKYTYIIDDPFDDPPLLAEFIPDRSPEGKPPEEMEDVRLEDDWVPMDEQLDPAELEEAIREREAHTHAVVLETVGDIPDAEIKPPDTVLFVCKLNPVTQDEDLDTIFSRFGNVLSAEVIRDYKTGDSLCYAFIEFEDKEACEQAYFKMDNALIDDRRIHVDFSQSVSKLWSSYRRGGQSQGGKGCFKCGELDHIAKDCTEGSDAKQQPSKYTLKDENRQHGGKGNQSYEMVFDGDNLESLEHGEKSHPGRGTDDEAEKSRRGYLSSEHTRHENRGERSHRGRGIDYEAEKLKRDFQSSEHKQHISRGEKRHHEHETDDEAEKSKRNYQNSEHKRYRDLDRDRRDSSNDRHKHDDRNRGYKEEVRGLENRKAEHRESTHKEEVRGLENRKAEHRESTHKEEVRGLENRKAEHRESTHKDIETQKGDNGASHRREKLDERKKPNQNTDMHRRDDSRRSKDRTRNDQAHDKKRFDHGRDKHMMDDKDDRKSRDQYSDSRRKNEHDDRKRSRDHENVSYSKHRNENRR